jgi:hypothetical protein
MPMPNANRLLAAALLLAAVSCGPLRRGGGGAEPAFIVFTNQSLDNADVFAVRQGGDVRRLGSVMAGRTETLKVPESITTTGGTVDIVARIFARGIAPRTGPVTLSPGDRLAVTLPSDEKLLTALPVREP